MDEYFDFSSYIVPPILDPSPSRQPDSAPSYETPWWADTVNRAIERGYQAYTIQEAGYPQYPTYPTSQPTPMPLPAHGVQPQPQPSGAGIQLSTNTLMILGLVGFALFVGKGRR